MGGLAVSSLAAMTPRIRHRLFLLTGAAVAALAAAPHPAGAAGWITGPPVSAAAGVAAVPMAAVSPSGERLVAWERIKPGSSDHLGLAVRVAPPGGDFGDVQLINDAGVEDPSLTVGSDGTAALVWFSGTSLHIATRPPGKPSFTEVSPFPLGGGDFTAPKVVMVGGDVYVTVATRTSQGNVAISSVDALRLSAGGTAIERLTGTGPGGVLAQATYNTATQPTHIVVEPDIAVSGGTVNVVWEDRQDAPLGATTAVTKLVRAAGSTAAGTIGAATTVDTVADPSFFRAPELSPLIGSGGGRVIIAYEGLGTKILYQDLARDGGARTLTADGGFNLRAGVDSTGALVVAYERFAAADRVQAVFSATVPPGGDPTPPARLTGPNAGRRLDDLVVAPRGQVLIVPDRLVAFGGDDNDVQVQAAFRAPDGAFGPLEEVSGARDRTAETSEVAFDTAAAAIGDDGRTIAAWGANDRSGAANERIFVSERDAAPPVVSAVTVPATVTAGAVVGMSATASDALSPTTVDWDFGDGTGASGPAVATAYTDPGTYTVTVTARDDAGNRATLTRTIVVVAPSRGTGGGGGSQADVPDRTPPVVTGFKGSNPRFRAGSRATAEIAAKRKKAKKSPTGTVLSLGVNERSTLVFSLTGKVKGRSVALPVLIRAARGPGAVSVPFTGRIGGTALAPGSYKASVTAIDAAGNRSRSATVRFTVVTR
jgi:PKD repeat protein